MRDAQFVRITAPHPLEGMTGELLPARTSEAGQRIVYLTATGQYVSVQASEYRIETRQQATETEMTR